MAPQILIVDDMPFMRAALKNILSDYGYEVGGEAANGQEAVEQYRALRPALALIDITMPVMDGITATRAILAGDPEARIILCATMGQKNRLVEALHAGAADFLIKPFRPDRVLDSVRKLMG